ncbi:putative inactive tyrosine-protein kinase Wsck [Microplitis demolitor]|uniref:putative inactive tyrosine-protein kinase Wsck n=1 Tax=Microplitis demolitor TaxID=69319 RepID=UPI0004CDBCB2|nr:putative inactive tyrosine-protein kinase Wsck [Microplitis demolitor]
MFIYLLITGLCCFIDLTFAGEYIGCFKSPQESDEPLVVLSSPHPPEVCIKECRSRYYKFAGLMKGQQCYCMSVYGRNGPSSGCTTPCLGDEKLLCGSHDSISVYSTGQKVSSPPRGLRVIDNKSTSLDIIWQPPDITNGNITSYIIRAIALETHAYYPLQPMQLQIQGESSDSTTLTSLQPGTKYNISITAVNADGESQPNYLTDWTLISSPEKPDRPKIIKRDDNQIFIELTEGRSQYGPLSSYQIIVVHPGTIPPEQTDIIYPNYQKAIQDGIPFYVTGEFEAGEFDKYQQFVIGNGKKIGSYYNAPLEKPFDRPQIGVVLISRVRNQIKYSYSDLAGHALEFNAGLNGLAIGLYVAIALLSILLIVSVTGYFILRKRHEQIRMTKLPEQQELTLQGPMYEVDNMAYIPEDIPERPNHYQDLKSKVWSIPKNFLTIEPTVVRRGRFGNIHMGTVQDKDGNSSRALIHSIADKNLRASDKRHMLRDLDVCIKAGKMNYLASFVGNCETPDVLYVVQEAPAQNLKLRLLAARSGDVFPYEFILTIGSSIATGLNYLDAHKIIHSHLCARSIGLTDDLVPKIMGFGIGKHALEDLKLARWTAPERFGHKKHNPAVVWSFAVVVWEMMSMGGTPYHDLEDESDVEEAVVEKNTRLPQLRDMPDPLYEVLLSCWNDNPDERPTFDELSRLNTLSICPITAITEPYLPELELNN